MSSEVMEYPQALRENYEELLKKCPYLAQKGDLGLHSSTSNSPHVIDQSFSKSKKRRLKKRLKALVASRPCSSEATALTLVNCERKEINLSKEIKISDSGDSCVSQLFKKIKALPAASSVSEVSLDVCCKDLTQASSIKMPSDQKSTCKPNSKSSVKGPVNDVVDGEILTPNTNIARNQVLIEREARKKAKLLAKSDKKACVVKTDSTIPIPSVISRQSPERLTFEKHDSTKAVKAELVKIDLTEATTELECYPDKVNNLSNKKSREDVLAEREAKKKEKQLSKLKKGKSANSSETTIKVKPSGFAESLPSLEIGEKVLPNDSEAVNVPIKSKAELKAERRAKQEAQRAVKEAEKNLKQGSIKNNQQKSAVPKEDSAPQSVDLSTSKESKTPAKHKVTTQQRIKLFSHLHDNHKPPQAQIVQNVHSSVIKLGVKYSSRIINGSNARCVALLNCLKDVILDYNTPAEKEFSRGLEAEISDLSNYLNQFRPMSVSMTNALRHIKSHLSQLPNNVPDDEAKKKLLDVVDTFIREQIDVAGEAICETVKKKIANDDVILIYSCSSLLHRILVETSRAGKKFRVVVVDGGPWFEGREMLRRLVESGLKCSYVKVSSISFIMRQATKVLLGAHALLANGCVMSRAGASLVALAAHNYNVPVLVCCETYKFCERVQTDAFVYNELGSPGEVMEPDENPSDWESLPHLSPLSLLYDITPPDLVTAVVTELAILPCTSVPVILRVKPSELIS